MTVYTKQLVFQRASELKPRGKRDLASKFRCRRGTFLQIYEFDPRIWIGLYENVDAIHVFVPPNKNPRAARGGEEEAGRECERPTGDIRSDGQAIQKRNDSPARTSRL